MVSSDTVSGTGPPNSTQYVLAISDLVSENSPMLKKSLVWFCCGTSHSNRIESDSSRSSSTVFLASPAAIVLSGFYSAVITDGVLVCKDPSSTGFFLHQRFISHTTLQPNGSQTISILAGVL